MQEIQKESAKHKEFAKLLEADLSNRQLSESKVIMGTVSSISPGFYEIDINGKANGYLSISELEGINEHKTLKLGSKIEIFVEKHDASGVAIISRAKVIQFKAWSKITESYEKKTTVTGRLIQKIRGGYVVSMMGVLAFCPNSQLSTRPLKEVEISSMMKKDLEFFIVSIKKQRGNVVVSHKETIAKKNEELIKEEILKIKEGMILKNCICRGLTSWGVFFSYGHLQLMVHVNELTHSRVANPSELISVGNTADVKVLKIEGQRVSGTIKGMTPDPFLGISNKFKVGQIIKNARVKSLQPYGAFVEIAPDITGLLHTTQMDHLNKNPVISNILAVSQVIPVKILELSEKDRKISLSYKDCFPSPWIAFTEKYHEGSIVNCRLKNRNDYGLFATIENTPIIGMAHINNLTFLNNKEEEIKKYKKNDTFEAKIMSLDKEALKVQLSIKDLNNPCQWFLDKKLKMGSIVTATVLSAGNSGIWVYVGDNKKLKILIKKFQLSKEETTNTNLGRFSAGTRVDCMIDEFKPEHGKVSLSVKKAEEAEQKNLLQKYGSTGMKTGAVLGDLLKGAITKSNKKEKPKDKK